MTEHEHHSEPRKPSKAGSMTLGGLVGLVSELLFPGASLAGRVVGSALYAGISPLIDKIFYRQTPISELYKNAPYEGLGYFAGGYIPVLAKYL